MRYAAISCVLCASLALSGCSGETLASGLEEPVRVSGAQFHRGALPGTSPSEEPGEATPSITSTQLAGLIVPPGYQGKQVSGRTSTDAVAVGLALRALGGGYWVFPVGAPDPTANNEYSFSARVDFSRAVPGGEQELVLVALDAAGRAGAQAASKLCFTSPIGDASLCSSSKAPPAAVISLSWDADADLDLRVVTPSGSIVDAKHPSTAEAGPDGSVDPSTPGTGSLERDSVRACVADGINRENLIFASSPASGGYAIYANLYEACGAASVRFSLRVYRAEPKPEGDGWELVEAEAHSGILLAADANGGARLGLFITSFNAD